MRRVVVTAWLIWLPLCAAVADIYRSVDAQGHVQYSDTPSPGAELISSTPSPDMHTGNASASNSAASRDGSLMQRGDQISRQLAEQAAARAVAQDQADARSKQCQQAQQMYQQTIEARRLYKVGPDGERQYLTDDEADQQRVNDRLAMQSACEGVSDQAAAGGATSSTAGSASSSSAGSSAPNQ